MNYLDTLIIQEQICFVLDNLGIEIESYWGHFNDVYYFQVRIIELLENSLNLSHQELSIQTGLLRIGKADGSLLREQELLY